MAPVGSGCVEIEVTSLPPGFNAATQRCNVLPPTVSRIVSTCGRSCSNAGFLESMMDFRPNDRSRFVGEVGDGNDVDSGVYGHLYGVSPDVPRGSDDHYRMSAHRVCILEQHLPGGYRNDGS